MDNFVNITTFYQVRDCLGNGPTVTLIGFSMLGYLGLLAWMYMLIFRKSKSSGRKSGSGGNRKSRDKVINDLHAAVLKNTASVESFALMVGALMETVKSFETKLADTEDYIHDDLPSELDSLVCDIKKIKQITQDLGTDRTRTNAAMQKIDQRFDRMDVKLRDFSAKDFHQFCDDIAAEMKTLYNAIFIPGDDDDGDDSDY